MTTDPALRAAVRRVQMRMLRRQDGCEQSHRGHDWHVHEQTIQDYETALRAALAAAEAAPLDVAWKAVEDALPEGWAIQWVQRVGARYQDPYETTDWSAVASTQEKGLAEEARAATPAAALHALAAALAATSREGEG